MTTMALLAPQKLLKRKLIPLVALVILSLSSFERVRPQAATLMHFQMTHFQKQTLSLPTRTTSFLSLHGSDNISDNMIQALVLSPEKGIVVAIGTPDVHDCPRPDYQGQNLTLSFGDEAFPITRFNQFDLNAGPVVVAHFNVTDTLWEKLRQSPFPLQVDNRFDQTTQQLTPMVDPALTQGWGQHKLSATMTVRKHYRFYKGRLPLKNSTMGPQTWTVQHTQERLDWWLQYYRSLGVQHFYIIDNEHDHRLPNLMVNGTDVTYIRAANHEYDYQSCKPGKHGHTVSGQIVLENMVIRMAHTEWLIVLDVDEFIVPGEPFKDNLMTFLDHYESIQCTGIYLRRISCGPLQQFNITVDKNIYTFNKHICAMSIRGFLVDPQGNFRADFPHQRKNILRPTYTAFISTEKALPFTDRNGVVSFVPSKRAYMAHLKDHAREAESHMVMADIVPLLRNNPLLRNSSDSRFDSE